MTAQQPDTALGPPPGWYLDPSGMQVLRWWDGMQWSPHTRPLAPPAAPAGQEGAGRHQRPGGSDGGAAPQPPPPVETSSGGIAVGRTRAPAPWAWVVAATPIMAIAIAAIASTAVSASDDANCVTIGWLIADVIGLLAAAEDARALVKRGEITGTGYAWLSLLGGWPYLWARAVKRGGRTNGDWWLLAGAALVWVMAVLVSVPLSGSTPSGGTFNQSYVQSQIAKGLKSKTGYADSVSCPKDPPMNPGSSFECVATFSDQSTAIVKVTTQDTDGDWIWQVVSS
jgi:hypothetical protein